MTALVPRSFWRAMGSDASDRAGISEDDRIRGHEGQALGRRLDHQQAIKRVLVDRGELAHGGGMDAGDRQLLLPVLQQALAQHMGVSAEKATMTARAPNRGQSDEKLTG
jgi:hypothetical protein